MPQLDWQSHLRWARHAQRSCPGVGLKFQQQLDMPTIRLHIMDEIKTMIEQTDITTDAL